MEPPRAKPSLQRLEEPETLPLPTMLVKQLPAKVLEAITRLVNARQIAKPVAHRLRA